MAEIKKRNRDAVERVHGLVTDALNKDAKVLVGAKVMWEETFGPVIPITL